MFNTNSAFVQVKVFNCLEMRHPLCDGVQRIRCYPFPKHSFHGRRLLHTVFLLPVSATRHFSLPRDKDSLQYGRVLLLFRILVSGAFGKIRPLDCAFIKYFDVYRVPDSDELHPASNNHIRLYEPADWYDVVPASHILGRLSIAPDFGSPTIPHTMRNQKRRCFPMGSCDSADGATKGSRLFYINHFAMTWSRSKQSLFRCSTCLSDLLLCSCL